MKRTKHRQWFQELRRNYLPISWQGICIYVIYVSCITTVATVWYVHGHRLWSLLANIVIPVLSGAALLAQYVASKNSK